MQFSELFARDTSKNADFGEQNYVQMDVFEEQNYWQQRSSASVDFGNVPDCAASFWMPELPEFLPECPFGFMWVAYACRGENVDGAEVVPVVSENHVECSGHDAGVENSEFSFFRAASS